MKTNELTKFSAAAIVMILLLGAGMASAEVIFGDSSEPAKATSIGEDGVDTNFGLGYNIGYESFVFINIESLSTVRATYTDTWGSLSENTPTYNGDHKEWAMFSLSVPVESSSWGSVKALYRR
jgi:hypothetical protein